MPVPVLRAYLARMDPLTADEYLAAATATAIGSGAMKAAERDRILGDWRRVSAGPRRRAQRPASREGHAALVSASGIGIRRVPARPKAPDG